MEKFGFFAFSMLFSGLADAYRDQSLQQQFDP